MAADDGGLWRALARRHVLRTVGIYLAGAWLLLQVIEIFSEIWSLPNWFLQATFAALALGAPVVAILSWIYDISGGDIVRSEGQGLRELISGAGPGARLGLAAGTLVLVAIVGFGLLHLWPDEQLDPRIRHLLASSAYSQDSAELGYRLYGFSAPSGQNPAVFGRFIVDTYNTLGSVPQADARLEFTKADRCALSRGCEPERWFADLESVPLVSEANAELLERYLALQEFPVFSEVTRPTATADSPYVEAQAFVHAHHLRLRQAAFEAIHGSAQRGWSILSSETRFHRAILGTANQLLMKMVALARVQESVRLRVLLLARGADPGAAGPAPERLSLPERSAVSALRFEILGVLNTAFDLDDRAEEAAAAFDKPSRRALFQVLPYRRNATLNLWALAILEVAEASLLEAPELVEWASSWAPPRPGFLHYLTNGAGVMIYGEGPPPFWVNYLYRLHDLDRIILLAQIAERMVGDQVTAAQANGWLQALPAGYLDPYTGGRAIWEDNLLHFPDAGMERENRDDPALDLPLP